MHTHEAETCGGEPAALPKWAALIDDVVVPAPQRVVSITVLKSQASIPDDFLLVRDHNSPYDVVFQDHENVDLALGNVFYRLKRCEAPANAHCHEAAKLAFVVDDRPEITTRGNQNGTTLRNLFTLPHHVRLVRDTEGPNDINIDLNSAAEFTDGPVYYTRQVQAGLRITVNHRVFTEHEGVKPVMTGLEIATLAYPEDPSQTSVTYVSQSDRTVAHDESIHIQNCDVFEVVRKQVTGGFEMVRIERELASLRDAGKRVTFLPGPNNAVVYHDLRSRDRGQTVTTDVLVQVPSGYPGQMLDGAYLPHDSPMIGRVKGSPQDGQINALGRTWRLISYHPHNGGGAPPWNPTVHGFHTYVGELLSWLNNLQ